MCCKSWPHWPAAGFPSLPWSCHRPQQHKMPCVWTSWATAGSSPCQRSSVRGPLILGPGERSQHMWVEVFVCECVWVRKRDLFHIQKTQLTLNFSLRYPDSWHFPHPCFIFAWICEVCAQFKFTLCANLVLNRRLIWSKRFRKDNMCSLGRVLPEWVLKPGNELAF